MLFTLKLHCVIFLLILYTQLFSFGVLSWLYFSVLINLRFSVNYLNLFLIYLNISQNHEWVLNIAKCFSAFMSLSLDRFSLLGPSDLLWKLSQDPPLCLLSWFPYFLDCDLHHSSFTYLLLWSMLWLLLSGFSCVRLCATPQTAAHQLPCPWDSPGSPTAPLSPGILQAAQQLPCLLGFSNPLEWVAISFSSAWKWKVKVKSLSHVWLNCGPPGSSIHGIFQARYWDIKI